MNPALETDPVLVDERMFYAEIKRMIKELWLGVIAEADVLYDPEMKERRTDGWSSAIPIVTPPNDGSIWNNSMTVASCTHSFRSPMEFSLKSDTIKSDIVAVLKREQATRVSEMYVFVTVVPKYVSYEVALLLPFEREEKQ